jgi:putative transposase
MLRIVEYKIYPNKTQLQKFDYILNQGRLLYNSALEQRITEYKERKKSISYYDQAKSFKGKFNIPASMNQSILRKLDITYKSFFRRGFGFPRFKPYQRYNCIELRQYKTDGELRNGKLHLWKMDIKIKGGQEIVNPKQGRLIKRVDGWYWQITCNYPDVEKKKKIESAVGIDVGLKLFLVDSNNNQIKSPKFFRNSENKLVKEQRILSRRKKGGYKRKQSIKKVAKIHLKIQRQRKDFLHKLSKTYSSYDLIAVEKLGIRNMLKNRHLSKSIQDASWDIFFNYLRYKAESAGSHLIEVNPRHTSQKCSECGALVQKSLSVRTHICHECGFIADRDYNASLNILRLGMSRAGEMGLPISLKAETIGLPSGNHQL